MSWIVIDSEQDNNDSDRRRMVLVRDEHPLGRGRWNHKRAPIVTTTAKQHDARRSFNSEA